MDVIYEIYNYYYDLRKKYREIKNGIVKCTIQGHKYEIWKQLKNDKQYDFIACERCGKKLKHDYKFGNFRYDYNLHCLIVGHEYRDLNIEYPWDFWNVDNSIKIKICTKCGKEKI